MVNYMNIYKNIKNFLYDENALMALFNNSIYIYNYQEVVTLTSEEVIIKLDKKILHLGGEDFKIKSMLPKELQIFGLIRKIEVTYE